MLALDESSRISFKDVIEHVKQKTEISKKILDAETQSSKTSLKSQIDQLSHRIAYLEKENEELNT